MTVTVHLTAHGMRWLVSGFPCPSGFGRVRLNALSPKSNVEVTATDVIVAVVVTECVAQKVIGDALIYGVDEVRRLLNRVLETAIDRGIEGRRVGNLLIDRTDRPLIIGIIGILTVRSRLLTVRCRRPPLAARSPAAFTFWRRRRLHGWARPVVGI